MNLANPLTEPPAAGSSATQAVAHGAGDRDLARWLDRAGPLAARYGLVVVIGWIGAMKFTGYEAEGISGLVAASPLLGWTYGILSHRQFSSALGLVELAIAVLLAVGPWRPRAGLVGAAAAIAMFVTTLSFMVSTPGVFEPTAGGFPALSALPGQFLAKDFALLGISVWLLGEALRAGRGQRSGAGG